MTAVPFEARHIVECLRKDGSGPFYTGTIGEKKAVYISSGLGAVNASHALTLLIERYFPESIVLFGIGGAYPSSGLKIGDIAVAEKEIYADAGVIDETGINGLEAIGIPLVKIRKRRFFNEFPLRTPDIKNLMPNTQVKKGIFLTVSAVSGSSGRAETLGSRFNAVCENMEGAAAAHLCAIYGIPLTEIRGISNIAGVRDKRRWNKALASENCQKAVMGFLI
jgi:futalosine hydrolase